MRSSGKVKKPVTKEKEEEPVKPEKKPPGVTWEVSPVRPPEPEPTKHREVIEEPIIGEMEEDHFTKIGVTCMKCETPYFLLLNSFDKFKCTNCRHRFRQPEEDGWPNECPECDYYHCGDDMCCYGEGFLARPRNANK